MPLGGETETEMITEKGSVTVEIDNGGVACPGKIKAGLTVITRAG
jgi:hypothetical protein